MFERRLNTRFLAMRENLQSIAANSGRRKAMLFYRRHVRDALQWPDPMSDRVAAQRSLNNNIIARG